MEYSQIPFLFCVLFTFVSGQNVGDLFNYEMNNWREGRRNSYGLQDWDNVRCRNLDTCVSSLVM